MHTNKGQIIIAIAGAVSAVLASIFTAWGTAGSRVNEIDTKVQVVIERENNHYLELNKQMTEINIKLDKLIDNQSIKSAIKK